VPTFRCTAARAHAGIAAIPYRLLSPRLLSFCRFDLIDLALLLVGG
jgi:hypothetical protein